MTSMEEYQLFPDIRLICGAEKTSAYDGIGITYCFEGVREYYIGKRYFYLTAGSCIIYRNNTLTYTDSTDLRTITLIIDSNNAPESSDDMLFDSKSFTDKLSVYTPYITKTDSETARLFAETEKFRRSSDTVMLRIRAVEALMLISNSLNSIPADKREKALAASELICGDIMTHYTIQQLSERLRINPTTFKETFRQIFGCSVYAYVKNRKMFRAAELLQRTDMKIIDIAAEVGYSNASKFAKAFCDVTGKTPRHFRTEHNKRLSTEIPCAAAYPLY